MKTAALFFGLVLSLPAAQLTIPWSYDSKSVPTPSAFTVERRDPKTSTFVVKATLPGTTRQYTDNTLKNNSVYAYRVRAENKTATTTVYGGYSNVVEVKTNPKPN